MSVKLVRGAYLADTARVMGEVTLGADVNIWYGVSIRGDVAPVTIGPGTNVQDNAVVHCDKGFPNVIGANVTIGHGAIVHGVSVGDGTLIGMGATVMGRTKIGRNCLIAAGAVVPPGTEIPDGMVVMGVPAHIVRPVNEEERQCLAAIPPRYVANAKMHCEQTDDPRVRPWV